MTYVIKYVPNKTEDLHMILIWLQEQINQNFNQKIYHVNVNVYLMEKKCNLDQWCNNNKCWWV